MAEAGFHDPFVDGAAQIEQQNTSAPLLFGPEMDSLDLPFLPASTHDDGGGFPSDLAFADDFDLDIDFSVEDFLLGDVDPSPGQELDGSGASSSSPHQSSGEPLDSANQGPPSPDSRHSASCSPDSGKSSAASGVTDREVKAEQEKTGWSLKRKQDKEDEEEEGASSGDHSNPDSDGNPRSSKFRRSEEASSPCAFTAGSEEDEKRKERLMRNRESAQLSRQRKKQYVEELEEKVKAMHSTINELNSKISYIVAENVSLRQQLVGTGAPPAAAVYPAPPGMAPLHFPWVPGYALAPQGHVPLVPIPRLKPQKPAPFPKTKKSEHKKGEHKTKKLASVSLLGVLLVMLFFGAVVPGVNNIFGGKRTAIGVTKGRILSVSGGRDLNTTDKIGHCGGKMGLDNHGIDKLADARYQNREVTFKTKTNGIGSMSGSDGSGFAENSSQILPAFLYVPRNGKHVKINGNLIIQSVLASEKAMAQMKTKKSASKGETSLAIAENMRRSALVVPQAGHEIDQRAKTYRTNTDSNDKYKNFKSISADGPLQQWFREGMAGPILSSGMCTEVFQFEVPPSSIIPATSVVNSTSIINASENAPPMSEEPRRMKNRRTLYPEPIHLGSGTSGNRSEQFEKASESSNDHQDRPASSIVVSVLVDPREVGDGDTDARISPKSISHIFVVVLLDSVKYVTYSCVLPFKSTSPVL